MKKGESSHIIIPNRSTTYKLMDVTMHSVKSSHVHSIGYTEASETLWARYKNGAVYTFSPVTREEWDAIRTAPSTGKALRAINNRGKYMGTT